MSSRRLKFYNDKEIAVELFGFITNNNMGQVYFKNANFSDLITDTDIDVFLLKCFTKAKELGWRVDKDWTESISYIKNSFKNLQIRARHQQLEFKNN